VIFNKEWEVIKQQVASIRAENCDLEISSNLVLMLMAAEDHRYGKHPGVDPISVCRAIWKSLFCGKREGASTIAMQFVRVTTGRYERTLKRKLIEMYLSLLLTKKYRESDIPRLYLAAAYYGWKMNGLKQVSKRLRLDMSTLSRIEAASIVARLKYPEPKQLTSKRCLQIDSRVKYILSRADKLHLKLDNAHFSLSSADGTI